MSTMWQVEANSADRPAVAEHRRDHGEVVQVAGALSTGRW